MNIQTVIAGMIIEENDKKWSEKIIHPLYITTRRVSNGPYVQDTLKYLGCGDLLDSCLLNSDQTLLNK